MGCGGNYNTRGTIMADNTMDKFLKKYYKQLHFNAMPDDVRARFLDWIKNGTLTDDMKLWVRDYMTQNPDGTYSFNELPDPANDKHLSEEEARQLFIAFQSAFANMAANAYKYKDKNSEVYDFINDHFGEFKLFNISPANDECKAGIQKIIDLLKTNPQIKRIVLHTCKDDEGKPVFEKEADLNKLISNCDQGNYDTNAEVQRKIQKVASTLEDIALSNNGTTVAETIEKIEGSLTSVLDPKAFAMDPNRIDPDKLDKFRKTYLTTEKTGLLQVLYYNDNIRKEFAAYDNGVITKPINSAEKDVNYQDENGQNYVSPKSKDTKTPLQRLEEWAIDTYKDFFDKYDELRGGKLFYTQEGKEIFKAIDKAKIKPADGLKTLLDKAKEVEGKINNPEVRKHFKWFVETMTQIAKDKPKAVEGAWSNSTQMKAVISEIILKATDPKNHDPHAMDKAKTAMEIMNAMKYGMMTSKIMDTMKQTDFSIFSDGGLSWNNNEAIQFVTRAFDKSIKAAFLAVGYAVTITKNKINLSGMQISNDGNSALAKRFKEAKDNLAKDSASNKQKIQDTIDNIDKSITGTTVEQRKANTDLLNRGLVSDRQRDVYKQITEKRIEDYKEKMEKAIKAKEDAQNTIDEKQGVMDRFQSVKDEYEKNKRIVKQEDLKDLEKQKNENNAALQEQIDQLNASLQKQINDPEQRKAWYNAVQQKIVQLGSEMMTNEQNYKKAKLDHADKEKEAQKELDATKNYGPELKDKRLKDIAKLYDDAEKDRNNAQQALKDAEKDFEDAKNEHDTLANDSIYQNINKFDEATQKLKELNDTRAKEQNALDNWDKEHVNNIHKLVEFWNDLQNGENVSWFGRTSVAQEVLDARLLQQKLMQNQNS